jgi:hypothetical protein
MAVNLGEQVIRQVLMTIGPSEELCTTEFWAMYFVVALMNASSQLKRVVARFLILACAKKLPTLLATIEVVVRALGCSAEALKQLVVLEYGNLILDAESEMSVDKYLVL